MSRVIAVPLAIILSSFLLLGQDTSKRTDLQKKDNKDFTVVVDTTLIQVPVSVFDKDGRPINSLTQDSFQVFEDKTPQKITVFKHEDVPTSLGLVIDNSGSMRNKRERVNSAALTFVRESNPEDETFIVNFDDSPYLDQDFTGSIGDLMDALDNIDTRGETALYDAVSLSLSKVIKDGKRDSKALLVVTDGEDNVSKYKYEQVLKQLKDAKVTVYTIGLLEENDQRGGLFHPSPAKHAKDVLVQFAEATGGVAYFPKTIDEVENICKEIAHDLRNRYTIGYTPSNTKLDGTFRKIDVVVSQPKAIASKINYRWKPGYSAPTAAPER